MGKGFIKKVSSVALTTTLLFGGGTPHIQAAETNAKTTYTNAVENTMKDQWDRIEKYRGTSLEYRDRLIEEAFESDTTMNIDFDARGELVAPNFLQIQLAKNLLSDLKIETSRKVDPNTNEWFGNLTAYYNNMNIGEVNLYQNEDSTSIQVPVLYDKYISVKNKKMDQLVKMETKQSTTTTEENTPTVITQGTLEEIPNITEYNQTSYTITHLKSMAIDYMNAMGNELDEDHVSLKKDVTYKGSQYDKVSINIDQESAHDILQQLLITIKEDERFWNPIYKQMELEGIDVKRYKEGMEQDLTTLIDNIDQIKIPNGIVVESYLKDNLIAHETMKMNIRDIETQELIQIVINSGYTKRADNDYTSQFQISVTPETTDNGFTFTYSEEGKPTIAGLNVNYDADVIMNSVDSEDIKFGVEANTDYTTESSNTDFTITEGSEVEDLGYFDFSGYWNQKLLQRDENTYYHNRFIGLNLDLKDKKQKSLKGYVKVHTKRDVQFTSELDFPELIAGENTLSIDDASEEELLELEQVVSKNAQEYMNFITKLFEKSMMNSSK